MKLKKYDYVILAVLFVITVFSVLVPFIVNKNYDSELVVIEINGKEYKSFPLNKDATIPIKIDDPDEKKVKYNLIEIKDKKVHIEDANCPDKLCVKDGNISKSGQVIVCLPNKVLIQIKGQDIEEIDASTN